MRLPEIDPDLIFCAGVKYEACNLISMIIACSLNNTSPRNKNAFMLGTESFRYNHLIQNNKANASLGKEMHPT